MQDICRCFSQTIFSAASLRLISLLILFPTIDSVGTNAVAQNADPATAGSPSDSVTESPKPSDATNPSVSFLKLGTPEAAAALNLTDEQKTQIQTIIAAGQAAIGGTDAAAKEAALADANQKLSALLTEDQRRLYESLFGGKSLRFNFRYQKWADVLDWVASEADLSLVMDSPPPGTFHYSDSKAYTTSEAIDLLNGWLLTKGHTLVRRERMLMCLNLKEGLPEGAIPQITPQELTTRGRFEFLSVLFPLEGRPAEAAMKEVQPLLGTYGRVESLAQTGQLMVIDTAATLRTIEKVIQKIPLPQKPPTPPTPAPAPVPVLVVYPVKHATPKKTEELLKQLVSGTVVVDAEAHQVSVNAIPAEQEKAKTIIQQLEANEGTDKQADLRLYELQSENTDQLLATLKLVAPGAQYRIDPVTRKLVTWALPTEHEAIEGTLRKLTETTENSGGRQLTVYPLKRVDPAAALGTLQSLLPSARISVDARSRGLIVYAGLTDHQAIRSMVDQLEAESAGVESDRELRSYPVPSAISSTAVSLLTSALPEARVTPDTAGQRLLIMATAADHQRIAKLLESVADGQEKKRHVSTLPSRNVDVSSVLTLLTGMLPQATINHDVTNRRFIIVGTEEEHQTIASILEQVQTPHRQLKTYPTTGVDVSSIVTLLASLVPQASVTQDLPGKRMVVVASEEDHAAVSDLLSKLTAEPETVQRVLRSYPIKPGTVTSTVTTLLQTLVPTATVTADETNRRILITATTADHQTVADVIQQVETEGGGSVPELRFYPLQKVSGAAAQLILQTMTPKAQITVQDNPKRLSIVAHAEDHDVISSTLEKLEATTPEPQKRNLKVYSVTATQKSRFQSIAAGLATELTGMQVIADSQPGELAIWATELQHQVVDEVLAQLQKSLPPEQQSKLIVYPLEKVDPASVTTVLTTLFPDASITADVKGSRILVHAKPQVHEAIRSAVEQLDTDVPEAREIKLMAYPVRGINAVAAQQLIQTEFPEVTIIQDTVAESLIVRGHARAHSRIADILDSFRSTSVQLENRKAVSYPSMFSDQSRANDFFSAAFPKARVIVDPGTRKMTVWASDAEHADILQAVTEMRRTDADGTEASLQTYDIRSLPYASLLAMVTRAVPEAQTVVTSDGFQLLAWASPDDQARIQNIVDQSRKGLAENGKTLEILETGTLNITVATQALSAAFPQISFIRDPGGKALMAWLDAEQTEKVRTVLQQLNESTVLNETRELRFYEIHSLGGNDVRTLLSATYPDTTFTPTADGVKLMAMVTVERDQQIQETLKKLSSEQPFQSGRTMKLYSIRYLGPSVTTVLAQTVPRASVNAGARSDQLAIVATEDDHSKVEAVLQQLRDTVDHPPEKTLAVFDISGTSPAAIQQVLQPLMDAEVQTTIDPTGRQLFVRAVPDKQEEIANVIRQVLAGVSPEKGRSTKTYNVGAPNADEAQEALQALFPDAKFVTDQDKKILVATALPEQHATIAEVIEQIRGKGLEGSLPQPEIYTLKNADVREAQGLVQSLYAAFGNVRASVNLQEKRLVVVATPEQQISIRKMIEELDRTAVESSENGLSTKTYNVGAPNADEAQEALQALFPDAKLVTDQDKKILVATARPEQHATIAEVIDQIRGKGLEGSLPQPEVYTLKNADVREAQGLVQSLYAAFGNVRASINLQEKRLVVVATPEQQISIRKMIEELDRTSEARPDHGLAVFQTKKSDGTAILEALKPLLPASAVVTWDRIGNQLFLSAPENELPALKEIVNSFISGQKDSGAVTQTYRMLPNEADEAQEALAALFPDATLVTDNNDEILVATATPDQQKTIQSVVEEMMKHRSGSDAPFAKAYPLKTSDGENTVQVLQNLFTRRDNVRLSWDEKAGSLIALATPAQQTSIKTFLDQLEPAESEFGPRSLEMYLLKNVSGKAAEEVVKSLLQGIDSAAKVTFDSDSDQLIVTTFSEGHSRVKQAIERLDRRKEREFDVIQLSVLDATSAQYSLEGIFSDNYSNMDHMPSIQADDETQQLLIRATPEQLREIRSLLIRMGESSLKVSTAEESASRNLRVIPMTGDVESRIQKVKNLWPKIRKNQIRILTPESLQGSHPGSETPDHKTTPEPASQPDKAAPEPNPAQFSLPPEALSANDTGSEGQTPEPAAQTVPETTKTSEDAASTAVTADSTVESNQELPDVVIVVGDRSVTIASDDAEALDQLESLLRATSGTGERSRRGRDFAIYQLQNAGAEETAKTIREIYESRAARKSFDDVIIVPEERLNSVIVYAGRSDLDRIEGLLEVMDSEQKPDSGRAFRTNVIPLKFTDAQRVENIIRGIYRTELAAGSARRPMEIPAGIPASVAAVIRQMNATASSPLLTIEVQRDTNSLIIKAPQELLTEVSEVVSQLDSTAETSRARGLTLVPLSKTNSTRAMRILSNLLNR